MKFTAAREKYDELQAQFLELEKKLEISKEDAELVFKEHAEYEAVICQNGGMTISIAEEKVKEITTRCSNYKREFGSDSWQFQK